MHACFLYGLAAAIEFRSSNGFPTNKELKADQLSSEVDVAFSHRATAFLFYGPLQQLYDLATWHGDGVAREAVYQAQVPMCAQLGFHNYYTEVFCHVVNFLAKWPSATRLLLQQNCNVNLLGKKGNGLELDAYVESEVVKPLKNYTSQHTTVDMCEKLMANLDLLKCIRRAYMSKEGFDVHHTSRHSVQSSLLDQIKGAWFCMQKEFFKCKKRTEIECYPVGMNGCAAGIVPKNLIDVISEGEKKVERWYKEKLYECFPDLRYEILMD